MRAWMRVGVASLKPGDWYRQQEWSCWQHLGLGSICHPMERQRHRE